MHEKVLPRGSRDLLKKLESLSVPELEGWTLGGDTGLALQMGHRIAEDLDFFRPALFSTDRLHDILREIGTVGTLHDDQRTLTVILSATKVSFVSAQEELLYPGQPYRFFDLADPRDIALMKLAAISARGSRKDLIDLYAILRGGLSLEHFFNWLPTKYGDGRVNTYRVLKSLTYFEDVEREAMPQMLEPLDWVECKNFFIREAHAIVLP
jgi:hypothetical protein